LIGAAILPEPNVRPSSNDCHISPMFTRWHFPADYFGKRRKQVRHEFQ
jgi:hypothetical protein